jgi:hypothetical protein
VVKPMTRAAVLVAAAALACAPVSRVSVRPRAPGETLFLYEGRAERVALRGNMTAWRAVPLERSGEAFFLALVLPPGRYEYRLEVARGDAPRVVLPANVERVQDGFGGENAVLRVP